jgi:hypothetical protein
MRFPVRRASEWDPEVKPCEGSMYVEGRWVIDFESLDELMTFVKAICCKCILHEDGSLQIYDDYIE